VLDIQSFTTYWRNIMKTYNFIEAANSGRAMKTGMIDLFGYRLNSMFRTLNEMMIELRHQNPLVVKHILNAKYELEPKKITLSEREFDLAVSKFNDDNQYIESFITSPEAQRFKKLLGLV